MGKIKVIAKKAAKVDKTAKIIKTNIEAKKEIVKKASVKKVVKDSIKSIPAKIKQKTKKILVADTEITPNITQKTCTSVNNTKYIPTGLYVVYFKEGYMTKHYGKYSKNVGEAAVYCGMVYATEVANNRNRGGKVIELYYAQPKEN